MAATVVMAGCATPLPPEATVGTVTMGDINHLDPEGLRYLQDVQAAIGRRWSYPCVSGSGAERCRYPDGVVVIEFGIFWDGTLAFTSIFKPSGHAELDAAATEAIKRAAPFPPVPEALKRPGTGVPIRVRMNYRQAATR